MSAYRTRFWYCQAAFFLLDAYNLRYNLVCLYDEHARAFAADAKSFTLAYVAERCALHCRAFEFDRQEDGNGRYRVCRARPFYVL